MHGRELTEAALRAHGYRVCWREAGWCEVLAARDGERWIGHGDSRAAALAHLAAQMLPSQLSRSAWLSAVEHVVAQGEGKKDDAEPARPDTPAQDTASVDVAPFERARPDGDAEAALPGETSEAAAHAATDGAPAPEAPAAAEATEAPVALDAPAASEAAVAVEASDTSAAPVTAAADAATPEPKVSAREKKKAAAEAERALAYDVAVERFEGVERAVKQRFDELGLASPLVIRRQMTAWVAHVRACAEAYPDDGTFENAIARLVRHFAGQSKLWWPGAIETLFAHATPASSVTGLELTGPKPKSWLDLAEALDDALAEGAGLAKTADEFGWIDGPDDQPAAPSPEASLRAAARALAELSGPLDRPLDPRETGAVRAKVGGAEGYARLRQHATTLRWIRLDVADLRLWGLAMGRLRALVAKTLHDNELQRILNPETCPKAGWAAALGYDPDEKRRQRERRRLLQRAAALGDVPSDADLGALVAEVFELYADEKERAFEIVGRWPAQIEGLDPLVLFPKSRERHLRRKLSNLQSELRRDGGLRAKAIADAAELPDDDEGVDEGPTHLERIAQALRRHTEGKRALFVSNRADPGLKTHLEGLLGLSLKTLVVRPAKVRSQTASIGQGTYDFVLAATGFMSHSHESALLGAARTSGVTYVRVHKGRPLAVLLAIGRELGVELPLGTDA